MHNEVLGLDRNLAYSYVLPNWEFTSDIQCSDFSPLPWRMLLLPSPKSKLVIPSLSANIWISLECWNRNEPASCITSLRFQGFGWKLPCTASPWKLNNSYCLRIWSAFLVKTSLRAKPFILKCDPLQFFFMQIKLYFTGEDSFWAQVQVTVR